MKLFVYFILMSVMFLFPCCAKKRACFEKLHKEELRISKNIKKYNEEVIARKVPKDAYLFRVDDWGSVRLTETLYIDGKWKYVWIRWSKIAGASRRWLNGDII